MSYRPLRCSIADPSFQRLYDLLVKDLPKGSALTAIFDSCTSGTLLGNVYIYFTSAAFYRLYPEKDLPHYRCNNVYRPWVNKGKRGSITLQNHVGTSAPDNCCVSLLPPDLPHIQSERTGDALVLGPQAYPALPRGAATISPALPRSYRRWECIQPLYLRWVKTPTSTRGKGVRHRNASSNVRGGVAARCNGRVPFHTLMWYVGCQTVPVPP